MDTLDTPIPAGPALRGDAVRPGDAGYDELRKVHNAMIDRRPALIVRVGDAADVAAAIAYGRAHGLPIAVRGGGHSAAGHGVVEGGLVIDMRRMRDAVVDAEAKRVRAGAGLTWADLDAATQAHGLAVTGGRVSDTGVVGFTLGSGSGWLERTMGLAPDNLVSARLVTADGREVRASRTEHPDLFWALRGGGGNFGVVLDLEFRLIELGPTVLAGMRLYPMERAREVLAAYAGVMRDAPDELCGGIALIVASPWPFIPQAMHGRPAVGAVVLWAGDPDEGAEAVAALDVLGEPALDLVQPMPYVAVQQILEQGPPTHDRSYYKYGFLDELTPAAIDAYLMLASELPSPESSILLQPFGGAYGRVGAGESALGERGARWGHQILTSWSDPRDDAPNIAWTRAAAAEMAEHGRNCAFPNFVCDDDRRRLNVAYAPATLARLREVKRTWDPDNVFRSNHNIVPAE